MKISEKIFTTTKIPFFILLFICFASAILGDSVAEALILSHFSASVIARMYIVNACILFLTSLFLISLIDRVDRGRFFIIFTAVHCAFLFLTWCAVSFGLTILFVPLFSYSYISKIFLFLMFWTLANDIIDSRTAGNDFPFIAAGGTLGAILISFTIPWFLKVISAKSLLLVWIFLCLFVLLFFIPIHRSFSKSFKPVSDKEKRSKRTIKSIISDVSLLRREPLLLNMSVLYFLIFFVLLNQHYSFYRVVKMRFVEAESIAGFLGYFNGTSMFLTFIIQITLAGIIIKKMGSTRSMFMLPAAFCFVFGGLFLIGMSSGNDQIALIAGYGSFWGIITGVGLRIAFFDSFFSPNFQIFFSSLPRDIRGRSKLVVEGVVKPAAMVIASIWILFAGSRIPFTINMLILFIVSVAMIFQTFRIKEKYTERLAHYLVGFKSRAAVSIFDSTEIAGSKDILSFLSDKLVDETYEIQCYIIEVLTEINTDASVKILTDYMYVAEKKTRATIISSLTKLKRENLKPVFTTMIQDPDPRVVANSIFALAAYNDFEINEGLRVYLHNENNRIKTNTIISLWPISQSRFQKQLIKELDKMLKSDDTDKCCSALFAIQEIGAVQETEPLLITFYERKKEKLRKNRVVWHNFLQTVGKNPSETLIQLLFDLASGVSKKERGDIVTAVVNSCKNGFPLEKLIANLKKRNVVVRGIILKVLSAQEDYSVSKEIEMMLLEMVQREFIRFSDAQVSYRLLKKEGESDALFLLTWALFEECIGIYLENVSYIAAILDKTGQVKKVIRRINHENRHVQARALEVLDNVGHLKVNRIIIKMVEKNEKMKRSKTMPGGAEPGNHIIHAVIESNLESPLQWVSECAQYAQVRLQEHS